MKNKNRTRVYDKDYGIIGNMFGFSLFGRPKSVLLRMIESDMVKKKKIWIATVNPEFVMAAKKDEGFLRILQSRTTYNVIDGIGLVWALKTKDIFSGFKMGIEILAGKHRETLIVGADLMDDLCAMAEKKGQSVYFLGGWGDRSDRSVKYFKNKFPKLIVAGNFAGNRKGEDEIALKAIGNRRIDYLFVAYAMKDQEEWIDRNIDMINVGLVMGVGRSFDYYSGDLPRAPKWVQKIGFEWFFSLIMEPKRWKRQLELPKFIWMVLKNHPRI